MFSDFTELCLCCLFFTSTYKWFASAQTLHMIISKVACHSAWFFSCSCPITCE